MDTFAQFVEASEADKSAARSSIKELIDIFNSGDGLEPSQVVSLKMLIYQFPDIADEFDIPQQFLPSEEEPIEPQTEPDSPEPTSEIPVVDDDEVDGEDEVDAPSDTPVEDPEVDTPVEEPEVDANLVQSAERAGIPTEDDMFKFEYLDARDGVLQDRANNIIDKWGSEFNGVTMPPTTPHKMGIDLMTAARASTDLRKEMKPLLYLGDPGVGKTSALVQAAKEGAAALTKREKRKIGNEVTPIVITKNDTKADNPDWQRVRNNPKD